VADDKEQRRLEVLKMRLDFLKLMATLSGVATVVVLTIMQPTLAPLIVSNLALVTLAFGLTAIVSVFGMLSMMDIFERFGAAPGRFGRGKLPTTLAGTMFSAGVVNLMIVAFRIPLVPASVLNIVLLIALAGVAVAVWRWPINPSEEKSPDDSSDG
jgi:hypothetical protein